MERPKLEPMDVGRTEGSAEGGSTMELPKLEPMDVGQIFTGSVRFYLSHFWWFLGMAIVVYLPLTAARLAFRLYGLTETTRNLGDWQSLMLAISPLVVLRLLATFLYIWLSIAIFAKISAHYLHGRMSFWGSYKLIWSKFTTVLVASVFYTILFSPTMFSQISRRMENELSGFSAVVNSGIFVAAMVILLLVAIWFAVASQCIAATNLSAWQSMKQSKALVKGNMWRVIGLFAFLPTEHKYP